VPRTEDYIRPPLIAAEAPSRRAARWRFRIVMAVLVLMVAAAAVIIVRTLTGGGEGSPGFGNPQGARPIQHTTGAQEPS
jgi:hypothetical protein